MSAGGHASDLDGRNPFAQVPLGLLYGPDTVTIPTSAVREAISVVDAYLSDQFPPGGNPPAEDTRGAGHVLAVVGEHGTGKTHLAMHLLRRARQRDVRVRTMYLIARNRTFLELYLDFVANLRQQPDQIHDQVKTIYAQIVAASLSVSELTARVARGLTAGELDPVDVVERFGLMESEFRGELRDRLRRVTDNAQFATALTLLLRPAFAPEIWEWFLGRTPDPILRERGITTTVNTEALALEAMGVFALLHHDAGHRFVLAIDELEQILLATDRPDAVAVSAFKRLLEVFAQANGFLLLAGLPESVESLRPDVRQRVGRPVTMSPFTGADLREFILERQRLTFGEATLAPFTEDTVDYVVTLVGGVARSALKICHELYVRAVETRAEVTPALVRDVVRTQFNLGASKSVRREIRHTLDASGWNYISDHHAGRPPTRVDYWVVDDQGAKCAILLTESILNEDDVGKINDKAHALRNEVPGIEMLLVVLGVMPRIHARSLINLFGNEPLVYEPRSFGDEFEQAFKSMVGRLTEGGLSGDDDELTAIRQRLERLARQQENVHGFIGQVSAHLDTLRSSSDRQLLAIQRAMGELRQEIASRPGAEDAEEGAEPALPASVDALFADAVQSLYAMVRIDPVLQDALRHADDIPPAVSGLPTRLQSADIQRAVGIGFLLQRLVEVFRQAVGEWYGSVGQDGAGIPVVDDSRDVLDSLCRTFDRLYDYLPVHRMEGLVEWAGRLTPQDQRALFPGGRILSVPEAIDGLGERVRREILVGLAGPG